MKNVTCYNCFFARFLENKRMFCWKREIDLQEILTPELKQLAESCKHFDHDECFRRVHYPIGTTREEAEENRRAAILAALKEVEE